MKQAFEDLPYEKQEIITEAGYELFSKHSYRKCPVGKIAEQACISKSLLFYYFRNKKDLYMTLWNRCAETTAHALSREKITDLPFFEMLEKGLHVKMDLLRRHPHLGEFAIRAYYEKDEEVSGDIQKVYGKVLNRYREKTIQNMNPEDFREGLDLNDIYRDICYASEGYLYEKVREGKIDPDEIEKEYARMIGHWKKVYGK